MFRSGREPLRSRRLRKTEVHVYRSIRQELHTREVRICLPAVHCDEYSTLDKNQNVCGLFVKEVFSIDRYISNTQKYSPMLMDGVPRRCRLRAFLVPTCFEAMVILHNTSRETHAGTHQSRADRHSVRLCMAHVLLLTFSSHRSGGTDVVYQNSLVYVVL